MNDLVTLVARRAAIIRIDAAFRLSVRTAAASRLFPLGEALPSTTSAESCLPLFSRFASVGSEEAPIEGLASVRHSNGTCSFPAFRFHEWLCEVRREGISETRLTYLVHQRVVLLLLTFERQMIG